MGTRALTTTYDNSGHEIMVMYRQFDGYPEGLGKELIKFCNGYKIVNGYTKEDEKGKVANGMGCFTAQLIKHFKEGIGGVYIYPAETQDIGEEYIYEIRNVNGKLKIKCDGEFDDFAENLIDKYKE